jgi:hypothetical protein
LRTTVVGGTQEPIMILSGDSATKKKVELVEGTRKKMQKAFDRLPPETQAKLMNATVLLRHKGAWASGVIFTADTEFAYVITAKHCLYTLSEDTQPKKRPQEYVDYLKDNVSIEYGPTQHLGDPRNKANAGTEFTLKNSENDKDKDTWHYDIVLLKCPDENFRAFAKDHGILTDTTKDKYGELLLRRNTGGCFILRDADYSHAQMGYGQSRDNEVIVTKNYPNYTYKIQYKESVLKGALPLPKIWEIDWENKKGKKGKEFQHICELIADNTNSTGGGDSGGPLIAIKRRSPTEIYLVGVTSGANYFSDVTEPSWEKHGDDNLRNNAATYWDRLFLAYQDLIT